MALAILRLDGIDDSVELRTTDPMICRTMWRLMSTAVTTEEMAGLNDTPPGTATRHNQ